MTASTKFKCQHGNENNLKSFSIQCHYHMDEIGMFKLICMYHKININERQLVYIDIDAI